MYPRHQLWFHQFPLLFNLRISTLSSCPKKTGQVAPITDNLEIGGHSVRKVIVPGACAPRLFAEAASIPASDRIAFTNVIVCVGANYPNVTSKEVAADELIDFLSALGELFPEAQIAWSVILP